jgi:PST family polysaccharide transporter
VLRRIASNSGWWLAERGALLAVSLVTSIVLVRALGPAGYGELSYVLALVALLLPVSQLGISGLVVRALLEKPDEERAILRTALFLRLAGLLATLVLGMLWWWLFDAASPHRAILLLLLVAQPAASFQVLEFWFQARERAGALVSWRIATLVVAAGLKIVVALVTREVSPVAAIFAAEYLLAGATYLVAYRRATGAAVWPGLDRGWLRWFGARTPWLFASGIAEAVYLKIDIVMLERMRGVAEVGVYSVAARLSEVWYALPVVLVAASFPALWSQREDEERYRRGLQASLDLLCGLALGIAIVVQFAATPLVTLLFGRELAGAGPVLALHVWAGVFVFMRAVLSRWLITEDLLRFSLVTHAAGAVVNVLANLALIPRLGATGAALATVVSYAMAGWGALFVSPRTRPMAWMMGRALLLPLRWGAIAGYARAAGARGTSATL